MQPFSIQAKLEGLERRAEYWRDNWQRDVMFLTSAPWGRILFLRAGEGSVDCKGVRPPFFSCSPEGDFGTVHTGAPSEKRQVIVVERIKEGSGWKPRLASPFYIYVTFNIKVCVWLMEVNQEGVCMCVLAWIYANLIFVECYSLPCIDSHDQTYRSD